MVDGGKVESSVAKRRYLISGKFLRRRLNEENEEQTGGGDTVLCRAGGFGFGRLQRIESKSGASGVVVGAEHDTRVARQDVFRRGKGRRRACRHCGEKRMRERAAYFHARRRYKRVYSGNGGLKERGRRHARKEEFFGVSSNVSSRRTALARILGGTRKLSRSAVAARQGERLRRNESEKRRKSRGDRTVRYSRKSSRGCVYGNVYAQTRRRNRGTRGTRQSRSVRLRFDRRSEREELLFAQPFVSRLLRRHDNGELCPIL